jgi:hypothetical protein
MQKKVGKKILPWKKVRFIDRGGWSQIFVVSQTRCQANITVIEKNTKAIRRLLSGEYFRSLSKEQSIYLAVLVGFIIIAATISSSFSRDSATYNDLFLMYGGYSWESLVFETHRYRHELFFLIVSKIVYKLGLYSFFLFLIYASISLSVKFWLIYAHSKDKALSLALFTSYFFILHDSTQIRFSIAVAFVFLGMHFLAEKKKYLFSIIVIISAIMFHNAALVFIIMLFFTGSRSIFWLLAMITVAILLYPFDINAFVYEAIKTVLDFFNIEGTRLNRAHGMLLKPGQTEHLGIFKPTIILVYFSALVIYQYRLMFSKYEALCYNSLLLTVFFYILLKDMVDMQIRFRDMFFFSFVFLVPYVHDWMSTYVGKRNAYLILLISFSLYLTKFIFLDKMIVL